jgi:hypothetical protein
VSATVGADNYPQPATCRDQDVLVYIDGARLANAAGAHANLIGGSSLIHVVPVPMHPSVGAAMITAAVALAGGRPSRPWS